MGLIAQPSSEAELAAILRLYCVDTSLWKKNCAQLLEEILNGESYLELDSAGVLSRVVRIASVVITALEYRKATLRESHQLLPDGTIKNKKNGNLTEKVGYGEPSWLGITRGIKEELGDLGECVVNVWQDGSEVVEYKPSDSYSGLSCVYKVNRFTANWTGPLENFSTIDEHDGKQIFWVWK
jgi:hypothetical protein